MIIGVDSKSHKCKSRRAGATAGTSMIGASLTVYFKNAGVKQHDIAPILQSNLFLL